MILTSSPAVQLWVVLLCKEIHCKILTRNYCSDPTLLSPPPPGVIGKQTSQMICEKCSWHGHQLRLKWWDIVKSKWMVHYKEKLCSTIMSCWGIHTSFAGEENVLFQFLEEMLPTSCGQSLQCYSFLLDSSYVKNANHIKHADCCVTCTNVLCKEQNSGKQFTQDLFISE